MGRKEHTSRQVTFSHVYYKLCSVSVILTSIQASESFCLTNRQSLIFHFILSQAGGLKLIEVHIEDVVELFYWFSNPLQAWLIQGEMIDLSQFLVKTRSEV